MLITILCALLCLTILSPQVAAAAARESARVWAYSVMPTLFPFMTISGLLVSRLSSAAKQTRYTLPVTVCLGLLGGSPGGARLIASYPYNTTKRALQTASIIVSTASPMFVVATLSMWLGGNGADGIAMLASHVVGVGLSAAMYYVCSARDASNALAPCVTNARPMSFMDSISRAVTSILTVGGCMIIFSVALAVSVDRLSLPDGLSAALAALFEMATGCVRIASLGLSKARMASAMTAAVSFGGLSVFAQNSVYLAGAGVDMRVQFASKLMASVMSYMICMALYGSLTHLLWCAAFFCGGVMMGTLGGRGTLRGHCPLKLTRQRDVVPLETRHRFNPSSRG